MADSSDEKVKVVRIVVDASGAKAGGADAEKVLASIEDKIASLSDSITGTFDTLKRGLLGFISFETIKGQIDALTASFDRMGSRAASLGTTTDWLQGFEYALASSSVKLDVGNAALDKFAKLIGEAALGSKGAVDTLNDLGIKIYDAQKQVRPLGDLFSEAAGKIAGMEGSAKANALAIQAMGKQAQAVMPALDAVGQGSAAMLAAGQKAGAVVSRESVQIWEDLAKAADMTMIRWRAFAGENFATTIKNAWTEIASVISNSVSQIDAFVGGMGQAIAQARTVLREKAVADAQTSLKDNLAGQAEQQKRLDDANALIEKNRLIPMSGGNGIVDWLAGSVPETIRRGNLARGEKDAAQAKRFLDYYKGQQPQLESRLYGLNIPSPDAPPPVTSQDYGGKPPNPTGSTGTYAATELDRGTGDRINKRLESMKAEAAAQAAMADAAKNGAAAVADEESKLKALQAALEAYGDKASAADPKVQALAARLKEFNDQATQSKAVTQFRLQTEDLGRQNDVLQKRLDLIDAAPEVVAREVAALQVRNELAKSGAKISEEDIANRTAAVEKQELLNLKLQDAQRLQELFLAPLKQALSSMQSGLADLFNSLFTGGINSWQQFTDAMKKIWIRMMAELAAVSVIRPVLAPIVEGATGMGIVSPAIARQLGYSGAAAGAAGGSAGGGGISLPGLGLGGGGFNFGGTGLGSFLSQPIGMNIDQEIANWSTYGTSAQNSLNGSLGGLTYGGALGGIASIAGIGMGINSLMNARNAGGIISGASGIIGGGLGLASLAFPAMASTLGPIGLGVGILGMLAGGLFGGGSQEPPMRPLQYSTGYFRYNNTTGQAYSGDMGNQNGGSSLPGMSDAAASVLGLIYQAGGTPVAGKLYGGGLGMGVRDPRLGDKPYFNVDLLDPNGNATRIKDDLASPMQNVVEYLVSEIFKADVLHGGVKNASPSLGTALANKDPTTFADTKALVDFVTVFDKLGKAANPAKDALDALNVKFSQMTQSALDYGLSLAPIDAELKKETTRTAQDFIDNMVDPLAVQLRALDDERQAALTSAQYIKDNVEGVYVDMDKVATYYTNKEAALRDQFYQGAVSNLQALIQRLTYGDLANASPDTSFTGTKAAYMATLAQARAGDATANTNYSSYAEAYATSARSYFASGPEYEAIRAQIEQDAADRLSSLTGGSAASPSAVNTNDVVNQVLQTSAQQQQNDAQLKAQMADVLAKLADLTAQLKRQAGTQATGQAA